jgi:superfamily II DNA/RNA helicase
MYNKPNGGNRRSGGFRGGEHGGRPNNNNNFSRRGGNGGGRGRNKGGRKVANFDVNKFINKTVEEVKETVYQPVHTFSDFNVDPRVKKNIEKKGYVLPTPIQDQSIDQIIEGKDLIGLANTGTGKTAAFLIPLINKVLNDRRQSVLIVVPTRELAVQIDEEFRGFAQGLGIHSVQVIGGANIRRQMYELKRSHHFVIGTPGRIKYLSTRGALNINRANNIVLDEVDRMLDMGFINDIKFIIEKLPAQRQSLFFSATMPKEMSGIVEELLKDPVTVSVRTGETSKSVEQDVIYVKHRDEKIDVLHDLLNQEEVKKVLIFGATKFGVEKLSDKLNKRGFKVNSIHGDKTQGQRQRALNEFKKDFVNILVATDVAARGLDISDVSHVINFDLPQTYDDYVHRIGRTGRGGKKGKALTFFEDKHRAQERVR